MSLVEVLVLLLLPSAATGIAALYFAARNFGWLSLCPQINDDGHRLIAQSGRVPWLLSLTLLYRSVAVSPQEREVVVSRLIAWLWPRTRRVPFDEIAAVLYHFENGNLTVALRLHSGEPVHLFHFWGPFDDSRRDPSDDDGYSIFDYRRPHRMRWHIPWGLLFEQRDYSERTALGFAERLQELTGAPLSA